MTWRTLLPWATTAGGATVMYLAARARTRRLAWILGICNQIPWVLYAITTRAWGFLPGSALYGAVYFRNLFRGNDAD
jgi:hypothetical protein